MLSHTLPRGSRTAEERGEGRPAGVGVPRRSPSWDPPAGPTPSPALLPTVCVRPPLPRPLAFGCPPLAPSQCRLAGAGQEASSLPMGAPLCAPSAALAAWLPGCRGDPDTTHPPCVDSSPPSSLGRAPTQAAHWAGPAPRVGASRCPSTLRGAPPAQSDLSTPHVAVWGVSCRPVDPPPGVPAAARSKARGPSNWEPNCTSGAALPPLWLPQTHGVGVLRAEPEALGRTASRPVDGVLRKGSGGHGVSVQTSRDKASSRTKGEAGNLPWIECGRQGGHTGRCHGGEATANAYAIERAGRPPGHRSARCSQTAKSMKPSSPRPTVVGTLPCTMH